MNTEVLLRDGQTEYKDKNTKIIEWHSNATYFESDDVIRIIKKALKKLMKNMINI